MSDKIYGPEEIYSKVYGRKKNLFFFDVISTKAGDLLYLDC